MKAIILISVVLAIAVSGEFTKKTPAEIVAAREACWEEFNLSDSFRESMKKYEYPDDVAIQQAVRCTGFKLGVFCDHQGFHRDDIIKQFGEGAATTVNKCLSKKNDADTVEKWAWNDWKCLIENGLKEHFKNLEH